MLQDDSSEHEATWEFLDRRIDNVLAMGRAINSNSNLASAVQTGMQSIISIVKPTKFDDSEMRRHQEELKKKEQATSDNTSTDEKDNSEGKKQ
mmetsp:Transcript_24660/g.30751  ORF Transcript_24660/g.30751 Transcript_24660/m.30751 type:complete len:93 (-) Transcript_24660:89-367(-)